MLNLLSLCAEPKLFYYKFLNIHQKIISKNQPDCIGWVLPLQGDQQTTVQASVCGLTQVCYEQLLYCTILILLFLI